MYKTVVTEDPAAYTGIRPQYRELAALLASDTGLPPTDSNSLSILPDAREKFSLLVDDLRGARESIYIEHYRFCLDSIGTVVADILKEKAQDGADVRTIVDRGANVLKDRKAHIASRKYGIKANLYYKPRWIQDYLIPFIGSHREHRKIVLIDGRIGYMGGRNIQDKYFGWRDCDIRITGPAVMDMGSAYAYTQHLVAPKLPPLKISARSVRQAVADTVPGLRQFRQKTVQIVPETPWDRRLPVRNCFEWAINHAKDYFYFYNPYTPPPQSTIDALKAAARRGVDVQWIVPGSNDVPPSKWIGDSMYKELLAAGVKIHEWQGSILHTKQFISDDYLTAIGSANMDNMSFFLNLEVHALIYDPEIAVATRKRFHEDAASHCREITLEEVSKWSILRRFRNWIVRVGFGFLA